MQDYGIFSRPDKVRGIVAIKNLKTGCIYLEKSEDAVASFKTERFNLDLSMHQSRELQDDYTSLGLELFDIYLEREAKKDEDLDALLSETRKEYEERGISLYL